MNNQELVQSVYGGKLRVRVCGVLVNNERVLLINHAGLNAEDEFWNFPGGGLEDFESLENCLKREFTEETGLTINVKNICLINEVIVQPLHAVEFYFIVETGNLEIKTGFDPELNIIKDARWFEWKDIIILPDSQKPKFLKKFESLDQLLLNKNFINLFNGGINSNN